MVFDNMILKKMKKKFNNTKLFPQQTTMVHRFNKFEFLLLLNALCQDELKKPGGQLEEVKNVFTDVRRDPQTDERQTKSNQKT